MTYAIDSVTLCLRSTCMLHYVSQTPYKVFIRAVLCNSCWTCALEGPLGFIRVTTPRTVSPTGHRYVCFAALHMCDQEGGGQIRGLEAPPE